MTNTNQPTIRLHESDNVVIALQELEQGMSLPAYSLTLREQIPRSHKLAIQRISAGEKVVRYGQIIGEAKQIIDAGEHVHSHNLGMGDYKQDYAFCTNSNSLPVIDADREFMGFQRPNGEVGTRNYLGILTSVNCSGSVARFIAESAEKSDWFLQSENIDGVVPIVHGTGCGMSNKHEGYDTLFRTLSGYARHPNFAGILLVGLGCEVMQIPELVGNNRMKQSENFKYMTIQQTGGTKKTIEAGVSILKAMAQEVNQIQRTKQPIKHLSVALQCGGSDGYSGITANPALGIASDLLVQHGGTTILAETPEIYGAEHLLTRRAATPEIGQKLVERIRWWEDYTSRNQGEMDNNPSPGNKRGGLTTILEKSLGAVAKGGSAPLAGFYKFAENVDSKGFVFMDSPGYDPCSVTGQIASGANLVAFTTGRGSVSGYKPTPCIKLATNTEMYVRMADDIDINCGDIITDNVSLEEKGHEIFETFIRVASGEKSKSELQGFGGIEFVPWQMGAVM